jgi:hypothetical protein
MKSLKTMKIYTCLLMAAILTACLDGCKKDTFLQDGTISADGSITSAQLWNNPDYARNFLNNIYSYQQNRFNIYDSDGAIMASGTDEAVNSNLNSSINTYNNGTWSPVKTIDDIYNNMYIGIRKVNIFFANIRTANIIPGVELTPTVAADQTPAANITRLRGQAFFLRAFFEFELVKRYGSMIIVTRVLDQNENLDLPRNSFTECVNQITADCDSAAAYLPLNAANWAATFRGRATKAAAMALKSRLLLYAASPQYNPTGDVAKWQAAANAAKALIDLNAATLYTTGASAYQNLFLYNISGVPYTSEILYATSTTNNQDVEINNAPVSFNAANGRTDPTQNLVDAFEMKTTGRLITDPASGYDASAPYANRDPRLNFSIMYNGSVFQGTSVDIFTGGKDGIGANVNATKTGYYMRKFVADAAVWNSTSNTAVRKTWILYRYAEVLLNYAEALNEAQGTASMAAVLQYVNQVRARASVAMPALQTTNPAGNGYVAPTQDELRKRIRHERQVELCFEEHRFWDIRRWGLGETTFTAPIKGMSITKVSSTPLVYTYSPFTVETRIFTAKNYLYPIAQSELNKAPSLKQNAGY